MGMSPEVADTLDRANGDLGNWRRFYDRLRLPKTLPVAPGTKKPSVAWKTYTERDPTENERGDWFAGKTPDTTGIGVLLDDTDYVVLDCDGPPAELDALLKQQGIEIPHGTPTVLSGSGLSRHHWFRTTRHVGRKIALATLNGRTAKEGGAQLDLIGEGFLMLPPSRHPDTGHPYTWSPPLVDPAHVPELPASVLALLYPPPSQPRLAIGDDAAIPIPQGQRESSLCSILGAARKRGATAIDLRDLAESVNKRCQPPLTSQDLDRIAQSVARYPVEPAIDYDRLLASAAVPDGSTSPDATRAAIASAVALFQTPADLGAIGATDFVLPPYLVAGAIADLTAPPKEGKTRFRNYLIACTVHGSSCLGYPPEPASPVVLLTEEPIQSLREGLVAAGLMDSSDLHLLTLFNGRDLSWPEMVGAAQAMAHEKGARLLIVDTVPALARLEGEAENSAGHNLAALRPLQEAAGSGLAVLTIRHDRKSGGSVVDRGRGSSAWGGGCDVLIAMSRPRGGSDTTRLLEQLGRFDSVPVKLQIDRTTLADGRHSFIVRDDQVPAVPTREPLAARLRPVLPQAEGDAITASMIAQQVHEPASTVMSALKTMPGIQSVGAGRKGDPNRYWIVTNEDSTSVSSSQMFRHNQDSLGNIPTNVSDEPNPRGSSSSSNPRLVSTPERAPPDSQDNARHSQVGPTTCANPQHTIKETDS